jgi:hypothetical protein
MHNAYTIAMQSRYWYSDAVLTMRAAAEAATVAERAARSRVRTPVQQVTGSG